MSVEELIKSSLTGLVSLLTNNESGEKLIFPKYRYKTVRYSEQELRQFFLKHVEKDSNYFYSIETPAKLVYRFTNTEIPKVKDPDDTDDNDKDNYKSARFDVSLYSKNDTNELLSHIEFKYGNPDQKNAICKDFLKLICEVDLTKENKNYFIHYLCVKTEKGWESQTFSSLFKKYCKSIVDIEESLKRSTNQDKTKRFLEKLSKNLMNYLQNITVYLLCFFEDSKSSSVYRFSLQNLESYINNEKENSVITDKSWLNEKIFNTEN
ncbi:MAG: hypothetical protein SPK26_10395 [Treponema sp.]|nr:hypothetical protein [Treponema sp.]